MESTVYYGDNNRVIIENSIGGKKKKNKKMVNYTALGYSASTLEI